MFEEQQSACPNFTSFSNSNPSNLLSYSLLVPPPTIRLTGPDPYASGNPHLHSYDGLLVRPAFEVDPRPASWNQVTTQATDLTVYEHAGGAVCETTMVSRTLRSSDSIGVVAQHVVTDVIVRASQGENIQPFHCDVCNISCHTGDVLECHKKGKKHLQNEQKLAILSTIGPRMSLQAGGAALDGELEKKKHRLLLNGASPNSLLFCDICNVMCNNQEVFNTHLAGKKHASQVTIRRPNGNMDPTAVSIPPVQSSNNGTEEQAEDKPNTVQSAWCELCKISCTSSDVLNMHILGKKHLKNLQRSEKILGCPSVPIASQATPSIAGPLENPKPNEGEVINLMASKSAWCEVCSIGCDTNDMLKVHISGKKHRKNVEKSQKPIGPNPAPTTPMENPKPNNGEVISLMARKSAWCELCGIGCDTHDMLKVHISGKKHRKNVERSEKPIRPNPAPTTPLATTPHIGSDPAPTAPPAATPPIGPDPVPTAPPAATPQIIGPLQNPVKEEGKVVHLERHLKKAKRSMASQEDLETKKLKIMKGGADASSLRMCTVCSVVCNSPTVFISHLAGQKHAAMAVKQAEAGCSSQKA